MMTLGECTRLEKEILQVSTRLADTNGQESEYSSRLRLQLCVVIRPLAGKQLNCQMEINSFPSNMR